MSSCTQSMNLALAMHTTRLCPGPIYSVQLQENETLVGAFLLCRAACLHPQLPVSVLLCSLTRPAALSPVPNPC